MPGKLTILIFLAVIVWQIVQAVLQASAKKQERERMARQQQQRAAQARDGGGAEPATTRGSTLSQAERLAERRRAQLEELRARRQARSQGQSQATGRAQVRVTQAPTAQPAPRREIRTLRAGLEGLKEAEQADLRSKLRKRAEQDEWLRRQAQTEAAAEAERKRQEQLRDQRERLEQRRAVATRGIKPWGARRERPGIPVQRLRAELQDRRTLRQLLLLKEILDPPVSLREL